MKGLWNDETSTTITGVSSYFEVAAAAKVTTLPEKQKHNRQESHNMAQMLSPTKTKRNVTILQNWLLITRPRPKAGQVLNRDPRYKRTVGQVEMSLICHQQRTRQELVIR